MGWEAGSKSIQIDGIKAEDCHGTRLLILDSLTAPERGHLPGITVQAAVVPWDGWVQS